MRSREVTVDVDVKPKMILRRYIDLPKFLDLIHTRALYLQRADGFSDRFEGALTPAIRKALNEAHKNGTSKRSANDFYRRGRLGNFVSCWTISARDSMALWQLYGGLKTCLAITTTVDMLIKVAHSWKENASICRVQYVNHPKSPDMVVGRYIDMLRYKHEAYAYEKELRLIIPRQGGRLDDNPRFLRLPLIDVGNLVRSVVVAPEAEDWFYDAVADLVRRYDLNAPVRRSKLAFMRT